MSPNPTFNDFYWSFHRIDSLGRSKGVRILMKSEREMVASDSTISMVARIIDPEVLRKYLICGYKKLKQEGYMKVGLTEDLSGQQILTHLLL
jgi:hypothetical protein